MKDMGKKQKGAFVSALAISLFASVATQAQMGGNQSGGSNSGATAGATSAGNLAAATAVQQQLSQQGPSVTPANPNDPSYRGSLVTGKATPGVLPLTLDEAMQRGLRSNLGLILQSSQEKAANGQRL